MKKIGYQIEGNCINKLLSDRCGGPECDSMGRIEAKKQVRHRALRSEKKKTKEKKMIREDRDDVSADNIIIESKTIMSEHTS